MKIVTIVGARPQFIKAAVVSMALAAQGTIKEVLVHTGQHFDPGMSDIFFAETRYRAACRELGNPQQGARRHDRRAIDRHRAAPA